MLKVKKQLLGKKQFALTFFVLVKFASLFASPPLHLVATKKAYSSGNVICVMYTCMPGSVRPCLALPCLALPCLALPCLALPCLALPCLALPCLALPCLAHVSIFEQNLAKFKNETGRKVMVLFIAR